MRDRTRSRRHLPLTLVGLLAVGALLAACTPEPPPPPPPPPSPPTHPECGSVDPAADGTSLTVESADGTRKVVSVPDGRNVDDQVQSAQRAGNKVLEVEPEVPVSVAVADGPSNDPYFNAGAAGGPAYGLWGLKRIDAPGAWGSAPLKQGSGVTVAVIDTGVQADHPGLSGQVLPGKDYVAAAPFDGRVDGNGHGTHVAGTIAEVDDATGGIGVAPQVKILPVRVLGCSGGGSSSDVASGIYWAVDHGAKVISLSLGTGSQSTTILLAVEYALAHDVVVAAAGGNGGASCTTPTTPTSTIPPTSAPTLPPSTSATSTTSTPVGTAAATTTTTTAPAATTRTASEVGNDAPATAEAVVIEACPGTPFSNPLYPAAYAIGRPGLLAVAATGINLSLVIGSPPDIPAGPIDWQVDVGNYVGATDVIAKVGTFEIKSSVNGVLTARSVAEGATVDNGTVIGAFLSADNRAPYSNVNDYLTVAAPGGGTGTFGIWSTVPGGYGYKSGTSMATPHVSAVAALVRSKCPALTAAQVMSAITSTAQNLGPAGWDPTFGAGMVQAEAAVTAAC